MQTILKRAWYKEPYVWLIIFFPAIAVIGGIITIYIAVVTSDGLVVDDYYKQGLEINRTLAREKTAAQYGLLANVHFDMEHKSIRLILTKKTAYHLPSQVTLSLTHRTRPGFDKEIVLPKISNNEYYAPLPHIEIGNWNVRLLADDWRLVGITNLPKTQMLTISPY